MFIELWHSNIKVEAGSRNFEQLANFMNVTALAFMHTLGREDSGIIVIYILRTLTLAESRYSASKRVKITHKDLKTPIYPSLSKGFSRFFAS